MLSDHLPAVSVWDHRASAGRHAAEGVRSGFGHLSVHRHEHLRVCDVARVLSDDDGHGSREGVRGRGDRSVPPADHSEGQDPRAAVRVLPARSAEPVQPAGDGGGVPGGGVLPGLPRGAGGEESEVPRTAGHLPDPSVLHEQHADHHHLLADVEPHDHLADALAPLGGQLPGAAAGPMVSRPAAVASCGRSAVLPDRPSLLLRSAERPHPARRLPGVHAGRMRCRLATLDRVLRNLREGCGEAAERRRTDHEGLSRHRAH